MAVIVQGIAFNAITMNLAPIPIKPIPEDVQFGWLKHPAEILRAVGYSPDGRLAFTAGDDNVVRLWDVAKNELRSELGHNGLVEAVAFSHDGKTLLTGSQDRTARLW